MLHQNRMFGVIAVQSVGELVENLTEHTWTLCTGFSLQGLLFLNDSFSEDGAQEYAVVRDGRQIESLTVSWMSRAEAWTDVDWLVRGGGGNGWTQSQHRQAFDHLCNGRARGARRVYVSDGLSTGRPSITSATAQGRRGFLSPAVSAPAGLRSPLQRSHLEPLHAKPSRGHFRASRYRAS